MIQKAEISDASAIYTLVSRYSGAIREWTRREIEKIIGNHQDFYVLAAKQNEELIGYAFARFAWGKMHVMDIAVKEETRGQGVGKEMMKWLINYAKSRNLSEVYLEVRANNAPALEMYQSLSFKVRFTMPRLYNGENGLAMYLPLSEG